jgi:hypothetical protein
MDRVTVALIALGVAALVVLLVGLLVATPGASC